MKYAPRKVYIKEDGGYTELSYKEFCRRKETDVTYAGKLFIPVQGCLIETEQSHYVEFYRDKERWRYLKKLDTDNSLLSLEAFEDNDEMAAFIMLKIKRRYQKNGNIRTEYKSVCRGK